MLSQPAALQKPHATLDPNGVELRESRDSAEHPTSTPIIVIFDVTGSMRTVPQKLQATLAELLGNILDNNYVEHPQILFGAVGDAHGDNVPVQVAQFESDNRMDDHLDNIVLEGRGGGGPGSIHQHESYDLMLYFIAKHIVTDAWEQRQKKGYLFIVGDEIPYETIEKDLVEKLIDDGIEDDVPLQDVVDQILEKWEPFFIIPGGSMNYSNPEVFNTWSRLFGQRVQKVDSPDAIAKEIAYLIGQSEGTI